MERIRFNCNGHNGPVYGCNKPGNNSGEYVSTKDLAELMDAVKAVRKSDCGGWLKDCQWIFTCSDGREKRQELARLLDRLYKVAGV